MPPAVYSDQQRGSESLVHTGQLRCRSTSHLPLREARALRRRCGLARGSKCRDVPDPVLRGRAEYRLCSEADSAPPSANCLAAMRAVTSVVLVRRA